MWPTLLSLCLALSGKAPSRPAPLRRPGFRRPRRPQLEVLEDRTVLSPYVMTTTADNGQGWLRDAINQIDADTSHALYTSPSDPTPDEIDFDLPTSDAGYRSSTTSFTIQPGALLPVDVESEREIGRVGAPTDAGSGVAFSPDGRRLVSVPQSGLNSPATLIVFDMATGREVLSLPGHGSIITSIAFTPDDNRIASASLTEVKVWDGTPLASMPEVVRK
jgi:WD40 repeat protein